ncbi:MAG: hypothetical protein ACHRXM_14750 [Isosphaerales bacterium]
MLIIIMITSFAQVKPGPIDAFRSNLAASRVRVRFECNFYDRIDISTLFQRFEKFAPGPGPADEPSHIVQGRWDFDGSCEHYVLRITGGAQRDPNGRTGPIPACELIWDGETYAYHYLAPGESVLHVETKIVRPPLGVVGPFTPKRRYRLDRELDTDYANAQIEHKTAERAGRKLEVEIYKKSRPEHQQRQEIAYDPAIGYLPRFVRSIAYGTENGRSTASFREMYLIGARQCAAGGFVPTEWYVVGGHIFDFESKYPGYSDETRLTSSDAPHLVHFKVVKMEDQRGPVVLDEMEGVTQIWAPGGLYGSKGDLPHLSLAEMKKVLGKRMVPSNRPVLSNIDYAELHEFDQTPRGTPWLVSLVCGIVVVALLWGVRTWRRRGALLLLGLAFVIAGCGHHSVPLLTAGLSPARLIYDASKPALQTTLVVNNAGNRTLQLFGVDAGCSCRQIDKSQLPATLRPGQNLKLSVSLGGALAYDPQNYIFTFQTDHGQLAAPVTQFALPDHRLSPQSVTMNGLYEEEEGNEDAFELVHREIYDPAGLRATAQLVFPPEFLAEKAEAHGGRVANAPDYAFEDTTYRLTLNDRTLGLHRADVLLRGRDGRRIADTPIVWERLPFLSSIHSRVTLSARPTRTFLRCPDEGVELLRVLSAPQRVTAVLSSPREVVISLKDNAPGIIDGYIEVETTAKGRAPLRIPVVRYAPLATQR